MLYYLKKSKARRYRTFGARQMTPAYTDLSARVRTLAQNSSPKSISSNIIQYSGNDYYLWNRLGSTTEWQRFYLRKDQSAFNTGMFGVKEFTTWDIKQWIPFARSQATYYGTTWTSSISGSNTNFGLNFSNFTVTALSVTAATNATPIVVTTGASHNLSDGNQVVISGVVGNTAANGTFYVKVTGFSVTTFALYSDSGLTNAVAGSGARTSGGNVSIRYIEMQITGAGSLYIRLVTGTDRGYHYITINGSYALVNGSDVATSGNNKYIDGYAGATGFKDYLVASGVPQGTYTVRISQSTNETNASSISPNYRIYPDSITFVGATTGLPFYNGAQYIEGDMIRAQTSIGGVFASVTGTLPTNWTALSIGAMTANTDYLYLGSPIQFNKVSFTFGTPNSGGGTMSKQYYRQLIVNAASNATPIVIGTTLVHGLSDGTPITIAAVGGNTNANIAGFAKVTGYSTTTFGLYSDSGLTSPVAGNASYTSGGTVKYWSNFTFLADTTSGLSVTGAITWALPSDNTLVTVNGASDYWVRLSWSNNTSSMVTTDATLGVTNKGTELFVGQATGSQLEYAYEFTPPVPNNTIQQVGGELHGGELQTSMSVVIDGVTTVMTAESAQAFVNSAVFNQGMNTVHPNAGTVASGTLKHTFYGNSFEVRYNTTFSTTITLNAFAYLCMFPAIWYSGLLQQFSYTKAKLFRPKGSSSIIFANEALNSKSGEIESAAALFYSDTVNYYMAITHQNNIAQSRNWKYAPTNKVYINVNPTNTNPVGSSPNVFSSVIAKLYENTFDGANSLVVQSGQTISAVNTYTAGKAANIGTIIT